MSKPASDGRKVIARNKKALHEYHVVERWEAGIVLHGPEVKSLREGKLSIGEAFARVDGGEGVRRREKGAAREACSYKVAAAIRHVINTFFAGSAEDAAVALLQMSDTRLPNDVVARLTREVQKARKEGR